MRKHKVMFFLGNKLLGTSEVNQDDPRRGRTLRPRSYAILCPRCGTVWARWEVCDVSSFHGALHVHCRECDDGTYLGASSQARAFSLLYDIDELPTEVLIDDFIHISAL